MEPLRRAMNNGHNYTCLYHHLHSVEGKDDRNFDTDFTRVECVLEWLHGENGGHERTYRVHSQQRSSRV